MDPLRGAAPVMTKLNSIQALRGIAALAVFLCHLIAIEEGHSGRAFKLTDLWENGAYGVDLFFVISGFIMVWVAGDLQRTARAAGDFLYSRVTRIYPLWWLFAGAMAFFLIVFRGVPWDVTRIEPAGIEGPTHVLKSFLLWPQDIHPVLGVGWTLVHEMYFYIGFALLIFALPAKARIYGILAWGSAVAIGALSGLSGDFGGDLIALIFYPMTLEFIAGALVGYAIKAGWRRFGLVSMILGTAGLVLAFFDLDKSATHSVLATIGIEGNSGYGAAWRRTFVYGVPAALLIYGAVAMELKHGLGARIPKFMVDLGDWSYSLYLCHVLVISAVGRVWYGMVDPQSWFAVAAYLIMVTIATMLTAALTYRFFERPSIRLFRRWRAKPKAGTNENSPAPI